VGSTAHARQQCTCERVSSLLPADVKRRVMMNRCPHAERHVVVWKTEDGRGRRERTLTSRTERISYARSSFAKTDLCIGYKDPDCIHLHTTTRLAHDIHNLKLSRRLYYETDRSASQTCQSYDVLDIARQQLMHQSAESEASHEPANACASSGQSTKEI